MIHSNLFRATTSVLMAIMPAAALQAEPLPHHAIQLGNYLIPGAFGQALQQGVTIPVQIRLLGSNKVQPEKIADAELVLNQQRLILKSITLMDKPAGAHISAETEAALARINDRAFGDDQQIAVSSDATLHLDLRSFVLSLDVTEKALQTAMIARSTTLGASTVRKLSSVLNYDFGMFQTQMKKGKSNSNSYLTLDNTLSFAEHHLNLNGSFYGIGDGNRSGQLYRAMYERDVNGKRLAMGLLDTWNLQSLSGLSALSSSQIYGASLGTKSATTLTQNQHSLTPITVFLPAAGEVHIYRQGRLLNIQNFSMGSYEVDTSRLPYGFYDVQIEVVIDGKAVSKMTQTINKAFTANSSQINRWVWQLFGGAVDYQRQTNHSWRLGEKHKTWLAGASVANSFPVLSGLTVQTSNYTFGGFMVNESSLNLAIHKYLALNWQGLISQGKKYRNIVNATLTLPENVGSLWINREKSHINGGLPIYESDNWSWGGTINLNTLMDRLGQLTVSRTHDRRARNHANNLEYSTSLFTGRWGTVNLRAGVQRYQNDFQSNSVNQRYVALDFSLPLASWLSTGVSSSNGSVKANLTASRNFENSAISTLGASVSKLIKNGKEGESDYSASGFATYDTKYSSGTLSLSRPDNQRLNGNLTSRGSLALSRNGVAASGGQEKAGVMITTNIKDRGVLAAQVNGRQYRLSGKNNFIPLPAYGSYKVELMNDKHAMDSFDIIGGRTKNVTLYPGNVATFTPEIKQLVTVFGRMMNTQGKPITNAAIHNHIGRTETDSEGQFSLDIDKRYPVISLSTSGSGLCETELDLHDAQGVQWVGDLVCEAQTTIVKNQG